MTHCKLKSAAAAAALLFTLSLPAAATQAPAADDFERGKQLLAQGDAQGAAEVLRRAAEGRKKDADVWYQLGLALSRANRQKDARKAFERSVALRDAAPARTGLAFTQFLLGRTPEAAREAKRALRLDPNDAQAHYVLAAVSLREDHMEEAAREAEEALRLNPSFAAAALLEGQALLNDYGSEYERAAERYPTSPQASREERSAALEKRDELVEPARGRLRASAERLRRLAESPNAARKENLTELAETLEFYGKQPKKDDPTPVFRQTDVSNKAVIQSKPVPSYTPEAADKDTSGVVRLRAVLAADGRVKHIMVMKRLSDGLTEAAVAAARRIKFTPANINGRPVSQYVILEYNFNAGLR